MEYWVDGYNLILRKGWNERMTLEAARRQLVQCCVPLGVPVRIFFDAAGAGAFGGPDPSTPDSRVSVAFVGSGTADDRIVSELRARGGQGVTVVTDDRELRQRVKPLRGATLGVEKFASRLDKRAIRPARQGRGARDAKPVQKDPEAQRDRHLSGGEVDDWIRWMDLEDQVVDDPESGDGIWPPPGVEPLR